MAWDQDDWGPSIWRSLLMIVPHLDLSGPLLDVGCGPGRLTFPVAAVCPHLSVIGYDPNEAMLPPHSSDDPTFYSRWEAESIWGVTRHAPYASAWSMLVIQHLPPPQVLALLSMVRKVAGLFRLQYVVGHHHEGIDHRYGVEFDGLVAESGWELVDAELDPYQPEWMWVTLR